MRPVHYYGKRMNLTEQIEFLRGHLGVRWPRHWRQNLWAVTPEAVRYKVGMVGVSAHQPVQEAYLDKIERCCIEIAIKRLDPPRTLQQMFNDRKAEVQEARIIGKSIHQIITDEFSGAPPTKPSSTEDRKVRLL
jgi:hypothetical protein